jgi:hypothetical protein
MSELENKSNLEKQHPLSEVAVNNPEHVERISKEIEKKLEKTNTEKESNNTERARDEVEKATERNTEKRTKQKELSPAEKRKLNILDGRHADRKLSFKKTMSETYSHMSFAEKTFGKFIHNPVIEKTSEVAGNTIARPNAILFGSLFALIFTAGIYFWAKYAGYGLSGFETIGAFIIGWLVGIIIDFTRITVTGKD